MSAGLGRLHARLEVLSGVSTAWLGRAWLLPSWLLPSWLRWLNAGLQSSGRIDPWLGNASRLRESTWLGKSTWLGDSWLAGLGWLPRGLLTAGLSGLPRLGRLSTGRPGLLSGNSLLILNLINQILQLVLGEFKCVAFVAKNAAGSVFDCCGKFLYVLSSGLIPLLCIFRLPAIQITSGFIHAVAKSFGLHLTEGVIEFLRQKRLRIFRLLGQALHFIGQLFQFRFLLLNLSVGAGTTICIVQGLPLSRAGSGVSVLPVDSVLDLAGDFFLVFNEVTSLLPKITHLLFELAAGPLSDIVFELLKVLAGPGAGRCCGVGVRLVERICGLLDVLANLVELVAGIGKLLLLGGIQVFPHLVEIPQEVALFFAQAFQLA